MQRLRSIKQLGLTNMIYPGAEHTRFSHVLGCVARVEQILRTIEDKNGLRIDPELRTAARLFALTHDVLHVPLGMALEDELGVLQHRDVNHARAERLVLRDQSERTTSAARSFRTSRSRRGRWPSRRSSTSCSTSPAPPHWTTSIATRTSAVSTTASTPPSSGSSPSTRSPKRLSRAWCPAKIAASALLGKATFEAMRSLSAGGQVIVYCPVNAPGYQQAEHWVSGRGAPTNRADGLGTEIARRHLGLWELWVFLADVEDKALHGRVAGISQDRFGMPNMIRDDRLQGRLF